MTIGRSRARQQSRGDVIDGREAASRRKVSHHDGEWLAVAALAGAQPLDGLFVARVADQMEAAETLERHDLAGADAGADLVKRGVELRTAGWAARGLRMEAPVGGIGVFGRAGIAQRKFRQ